ncbi:uncharacterized protein LOC121874683 [Homarus americanus]|uniref:Leukocyte receptor cluster member 9-like n=1 Tax=Homarus americanus TaxID=6706 RepID=A0A8J5JTV0_HOMAM|nr:uncharacterized protein LOC121874683 [Homarus americanus]KAG7161710.1 Leukocyte receptor cluster member 9-like [Homarus americanus]
MSFEDLVTDPCRAVNKLETEEATTATCDENTVMENVCSHYLEGKCRFGDDCFNLHPPNVEVKKVTTTKHSTQNQNKSAKNTRKVPPEVENEKKKPLKTAGDVRKRIQWDPELQKEYFTVGYLDRFIGVVEKPYTAFSWEHLSMVDLDQLAVPQHRIQYYKYKGTKVWDKNERLDHVFGSAGNGITIQQVIREVDAEIEKNTQTFDSDEDSSDDELIVLGGVSNSGRGLISNICEGQGPKEVFLRATHFFCIKVKNDQVKSTAAKVQEYVVQGEPVLRSCVMPNELLHVTLAMVRIETPEAMTEAVNILNDLQGRIEKLLGPTPEDVEENPERIIRVRGLSTFGARVLYTKLQVPSSFTVIVDMLYEALRRVDGITVTNHFGFVPHMTLLKINRPTARERRSKYFNSSLYSDYLECDFGTIVFNNVHFCCIEDLRGPDGFYVTCRKIEF